MLYPMKGESQAQRIALFVDFENLVTRTAVSYTHLTLPTILRV